MLSLDEFARLVPVRILALVTDAFGGTGGIAKYDRDLISAIAEHADTESVDVVPRIVARVVELLPDRVVHHETAADSTLRFVSTSLRLAVGLRAGDWILCGHVNLLPVALGASRIARAPVILATYGLEAWYPKRNRTPRQVRRLRAVLSISELTLTRMREWADLSGIATFVLPNAVDLASFTPGPRNAALARRLGVENRRVVFTLGRMDASERAKGFDQIIDAMPSLATRFPDLVYVAGGEGSDRARLETRARELGVGDRVVFPGYVPEWEKADYYRLADVFAMPSRLEGFGYVFLEALASGVPVVASTADGGREAIRNGEWGLLVNPDKVDEIACAIESALINPRIPARAELDFFSVDRFNRRCHAMLDALDWYQGMQQRS
jgi:phosphatidylinositol alpha-1,6-mannosyltransferase